VLGEFELIPPALLIPHEDFDTARLDRLVVEIRAAGYFYPPVLVDRPTRVILDGHHRWQASLRLGLTVVPCYTVDYLNDSTIHVISRRPDITVTKQSVIEIARAGKTFPHKTTRHTYDLPEWIEPVPLDRLLHT